MAIYINPGNSVEAKEDREQTIEELECALKNLFSNFETPPIVILGDFN